MTILNTIEETLFTNYGHVTKYDILDWQSFHPSSCSYLLNNNLIEFDLYIVNDKYKYYDKFTIKHSMFDFISEKYKENYKFLIDYEQGNCYSLFFFDENNLNKIYFIYFNIENLNFCGEEFASFFKNYFLLQ